MPVDGVLRQHRMFVDARDVRFGGFWQFDACLVGLPANVQSSDEAAVAAKPNLEILWWCSQDTKLKEA